VSVPGFSDWLDGYADVLAAAAAAVPLPAADLDPGVAVIAGVLRDRDEADAEGDRAELCRLVAGAGLRVAAVWPGDPPAAFAGAGIVVALPYARRAAALLAERLGARMVEVGVPLGLAGTAAWVRSLAAATGGEAAAEAYLDRQLDRWAPRFEWVVPHGLLHKRVAIVADPYRARAFAGLAAELGLDLAAVLPTGGAAALVADLPGPAALEGPEPFDLVLAHRPAAEACRDRGLPWLERGFPSPGHHVLHPVATLGFEGTASLVEAMINRMSLHDVLRSTRPRGR
jgi:nitrogenase molybdenum-iron protein alpha/beta subunit